MDGGQVVNPTCKSLDYPLLGGFGPLRGHHSEAERLASRVEPCRLAHIHDAKYWVLTYPSGS